MLILQQKRLIKMLYFIRLNGLMLKKWVCDSSRKLSRFYIRNLHNLKS